MPQSRELVLIGGGHAHANVLMLLAMRPEPGARITLIAKDIETPYSGMVPGYLAGFYTRDDCHIDLAPLCVLAGVRLIHAAATGLDLSGRRVLCGSRPPVRYDVLSIDIGSEPSAAGIDGAREHTVPLKPIAGLAARFEQTLSEVRAAGGPRRFLVIGGGAAGVEVALAVDARLHRELQEAGHPADELSVTLATQRTVLAGAPARAARLVRGVFDERGLTLVENAPIVRIEARKAIAADGREIPFDRAFLATGAGAAPWLRETGLALDAGGFVTVDATLQAVGAPGVFAAGDIAANLDHPRPKAGVFAVRQGPPLTENLRRALRGEPPEPFVPQSAFLALLSLGDGRAIATRGPFAAMGRYFWRMKDGIDRDWMEPYQNLEWLKARKARMPGPAMSDPEEMRCAGCAAKIGAGVLAHALGRLDRGRPDGAAQMTREPEDAAVWMPAAGHRLVQSVDFFRAFIDDPYVLGHIAANHALGDIFAMGAAPHSALATVMLPRGPEARVEDDLAAVLAGAIEVLAEAGATLIGGHSAEGIEMAVGFAVNGMAPEGTALLVKGGLAPGERLVLTKALGTGALLAAHMRGEARGRWLSGAVAAMQVSQQSAARILREHGVRGATDVTGFGLAGHLLEMLDASSSDAVIDVAALPALDGALEVLGRGRESTLAPANRAAVAGRIAGSWPEAAARHALLFDPQTAGGLLAGVPADRADACLTALRAAGYVDAATIGHVEARAGGSARIRLAPFRSDRGRVS